MNVDAWVPVMIQLIVSATTLVALLIAAQQGKKKISEVKELVNGHSTQQAAEIKKLNKTIAGLVKERSD